MIRHNKILTNYAEQMVEQYARHEYGYYYTIDVTYIPDLELDHFSSLIMQQSEEHASEAIGEDNPHYSNYMLPALLKYLSDTSNQDIEIEFNQKWRKGITMYLSKDIQKLLDVALEDYVDVKRNEFLYSGGDVQQLRNYLFNLG